MNKASKLLLVGALAIGGGLGAIGLATPNFTFAEEAESTTINLQMTVSPMNEKIVLVPGEVYTGSVSVSNPQSATQNLKYNVSVNSYGIEQDENNKTDNGQIVFNKKTSYNQMMDWITLDRTSGEVAPNETQQVGYTITVPEDAVGGGQYVSLIFSNDTAADIQAGSTVTSDIQIASNILATVAGEIKETGQVVENSIPGFLLSGPVEATSLVKNDGNVHTRAEYTLQVWPLIGDKAICANEDNPEAELVMPEAKAYKVQDCNVGLVGIYKAKQTVKIYGESSTVEKTVIVCPIWLIVIVLAAIIAIVVLSVRLSRRRKARNI